MRLELPVLLETPIEEVEITDVIARGNSKLGRQVYTFSLPAVVTCGRGSTALCRSLCYADRPQSFFVTPHVQERYWANLALTKRPDFSDLLVSLMESCRAPLFRWHVSGDFYDEVYAWKALQVSRNSPHVTTWLYTRTWRDPVIAEVLTEMATLPNVQLWYSCDKETGQPKKKPARVRLAYMQTAHDDIPAYPVDLFFRENSIRDTIRKQIEDTMVCPVENGISKVTCDKCKICFTDPDTDHSRRTRHRHVKDDKKG